MLKISTEDWILFGPGRLYCPPFVSRYYLYRLFDLDRSLLFGETSEGAVKLEAREPMRTTVIHATPGYRKRLYLHMSSSARTPLAELGEMLFGEIPFDDSKRQFFFENLAVSLMPCKLPSSRVYIPSRKTGQSLQYESEGMSYEIVANTLFKHYPSLVRRSLEGAFTTRYRLSVSNVDSGRCYDWDSNGEWNLTVFSIAHEWMPFYEASLRRQR